MRSRTSFFNPGLAKSLAKRFWPLWLGYLAVLMLALPINLSTYYNNIYGSGDLNYWILDQGRTGVLYVAAAALLFAMAGFSHLYRKRDCGLINSLPLRRETVFSTLCITGLLALVSAALLTALAALLMLSGIGAGHAPYVGLWLAMNLLAVLAFYGLAVFCAVLTGSVLAVPVLYLAAGVAAYGLEAMARALMSNLIYGYTYSDAAFTFLSPLVMISEKLTLQPGSVAVSGLTAVYDTSYTSPQLQGLGVLGAYAGVGVALLLIALFLYRRRAMETAGDVIAVKLLRPLFKYSASVAAALALTYLVVEVTLHNSLSGRGTFIVSLLMLLLGAAAGYYGAEMLLQKSLRVFRTRAWGLAGVCAVLLVFAGVCRFDAFGYEKALPQREEIQAVRLISDWRGLGTEDPEAIDLYLAAHRLALENKEHNQSAAVCRDLRFEYLLKDGSRFRRYYKVDGSVDWVDAGNSELALAQDFCALPAVKQAQQRAYIPVQQDTLYQSYVNVALPIPGDPNGGVNGYNVSLTAEQALALYNQCILPDMADSSLDTNWLIRNQAYWENMSNLDIVIITQVTRVSEGAVYEIAGPFSKEDSHSFPRSDQYISVTLDARRTLAWLRENLDLEAIPYLQVYPSESYEYYYY